MPIPTAAEALENIRTHAAVNLTTASVALGMSPATGSRAVRAGTFPVPAIRLGARVVVPTAPLRKVLHQEPEVEAEPEPAPVRTIEDFSDAELLAELERRLRRSA